MVAFEAALVREDFSIFRGAAQTILEIEACKVDGIAGSLWYTICGGSTDFFICQACYIGIITTCEMSAFFRPATRDHNLKHVCNLNPAVPHYLHFVEKMAEAVDVGDFSLFSRFVRTLSGVSRCPGREALFDAAWWSSGNCTMCPECYKTTISGTMLPITLDISEFPTQAPGSAV
jgi:hypothetical protein